MTTHAAHMTTTVDNTHPAERTPAEAIDADARHFALAVLLLVALCGGVSMLFLGPIPLIVYAVIGLVTISEVTDRKRAAARTH